MKLFDREQLYSDLSLRGHSEWSEKLRAKTEHALAEDRHGKLGEWIAAWKTMPDVPDAAIDGSDDAVSVHGTLAQNDRDSLTKTLQAFHPWRKGPFNLFGVAIDTEWRSCLKWNRLAPHVNLLNRTVLDVGCGNGYYGWKMLHAGARMVLGLDPFLLFLMQFEAVRRYAGSECPHFVLPLTDAELPEKLQLFDVTFSMGVLYHRTSPIDHLQSLRESLVAGGALVLETLVTEGEGMSVLVPEDRYAKMRNVWFIPTVPMLLLWLRRSGFCNSRVIDVSRTTTDEQRRTDWMTFESLGNFLDPTDSTKTIEGYSSPLRVMVIARKS